MKLTKKYYVDTEGNMIGYPRYRHEKIEKTAEPFHAKLKIVRVGWLNSGCYFELQDKNGNIYSMNDIMFKKYIAQNDVYIEGDWNFYQQGTAFSIGL
jgi:hypothetical protein